MYQARFSTTSDEVEIQTDPVEQVQNNVRILERCLEEDLHHDVLPEETVKLIEK